MQHDDPAAPPSEAGVAGRVGDLDVANDAGPTRGTVEAPPGRPAPRPDLPMVDTTHVIAADPARVFAVLADGWSYPIWVVGAAHMRDVDPGWPGIGTRIHHKVGGWPLLVEDYTEVLDMTPQRRLELRARAWPFGEARVAIDLRPVQGGTEVTMSERVQEGPGRLLPMPLQFLMLRPRNVEALRRLECVVLNRPLG